MVAERAGLNRSGRSAASAWSRAPCTGRCPGWNAAAGSGRRPAAERRRPYEITAAGQEILTEQDTTMQQIVQVARLSTAMAWGA